MAPRSSFARWAVESFQLGLLVVSCLFLASGAWAAQLSGVVTNQITGDPVEGVAVVLEGAVGAETTTGPDGSYLADVPGGSYDVSFSDARYLPRQEMIVLPMMGLQLDVTLAPASNVVVSASIVGEAVPGADVTAVVEYEILDGSTLVGLLWTQQQSVPVVITGEDTEMATVSLPAATVYKDELIHVLESPPIDEEQLPPNVELPPGGFMGGLQERYQVVGINPFALEETGLVTLEVTVTTSSGMYADEVEIHTTLPWKPASGIPNVPIGIPVLLHAKDLPEGSGPDYDWSLDLGDAPGSSTSLIDATTQSPWLVPDVEGVYRLTVSDADPAATDPVTIEVYASRWIGAITDQDVDGFPVAEDCSICHNEGPIASDNFTPWSQTGHAHIFTNLLNTSPYYGERCFSCHTVGFDPDVDNGGIDDAADYADFLADGLLGNPAPDNWSRVLSDHPSTGRLANAQCENCHGPLEAAHANPSISIASEDCATCHGEPVRHGRYQQWQLSGHANYALAEEEGSSGSCSRCHTGNGFLAWLPVLLGEEEGEPSDSVEVTWSTDETHPQTCVTCHDPHSTGTTSGVPTDATVRISDDTPLLLAGFEAHDVGRGALCMTCHNTRRGLRNDTNFDEIYRTSEAARAPHQGAQADMLMGQNAYLVEVGNRGNHSRALLQPGRHEPYLLRQPRDLRGLSLRPARGGGHPGSADEAGRPPGRPGGRSALSHGCTDCAGSSHRPERGSDHQQCRRRPGDRVRRVPRTPGHHRDAAGRDLRALPHERRGREGGQHRARAALRLRRSARRQGGLELGSGPQRRESGRAQPQLRLRGDQHLRGRADDGPRAREPRLSAGRRCCAGLAGPPPAPRERTRDRRVGAARSHWIGSLRSR
jgi:hypothetical protein